MITINNNKILQDLQRFSACMTALVSLSVVMNDLPESIDFSDVNAIALSVATLIKDKAGDSEALLSLDLDSLFLELQRQNISIAKEPYAYDRVTAARQEKQKRSKNFAESSKKRRIDVAVDRDGDDADDVPVDEPDVDDVDAGEFDDMSAPESWTYRYEVRNDNPVRIGTIAIYCSNFLNIFFFCIATVLLFAITDALRANGIAARVAELKVSAVCQFSLTNLLATFTGLKKLKLGTCYDFFSHLNVRNASIVEIEWDFGFFDALTPDNSSSLVSCVANNNCV